MLYSSERRRAKLLFALSDLLLATVAFEAAYHTRVRLESLRHLFYFQPGVHALVLVFCLVTWVGAGYRLDLYKIIGTGGTRDALYASFRQAAFSTILIVLFEYLLRLDLSRAFLLLFAVYASILLAVFRSQAQRLTGVYRRHRGVVRHLLIVGTGDGALRVAGQLERAVDSGILVLGFLDPSGPQRTIDTQVQRYPVFEQASLGELLRNQVIDEVIVSVVPQQLAGLQDLFWLCDQEGVRTCVAMDFFPHVNSEMHLEHIGATPLLAFTAGPIDDLDMILKRMLDLGIASLGLVVLSPLMLLTAIAIKLTSPGPVIFRQVRCGLNGRPFQFLKFRSMVVDAEARAAEVMRHSQRATATKLRKDPRLTRIGGFLRKFSIDELPQLINILKGDMSVVGPRPAIPSEVAQYEQWQRRRLRVRPGLTCIWALNGRDEVDFETWMNMDMQYIDNWSLGLDCEIFLKTIPRVLLGHGAH